MKVKVNQSHKYRDESCIEVSDEEDSTNESSSSDSHVTGSDQSSQEVHKVRISALKGCAGIVFTNGTRMGGWTVRKSLSGLHLGNRKV